MRKALKLFGPKKKSPYDGESIDVPADRSTHSLSPAPSMIPRPVGCEVLLEGAAPVVAE
jgi:hypothetical protein